MITERDGMVFVTQPKCPKQGCGSLMVRHRVAGRMGEYGTDSLSFTPVSTLTEMVFKCKRHNLYYRVPYSELSIINQYPLDCQKLTQQ